MGRKLKTKLPSVPHKSPPQTPKITPLLKKEELYREKQQQHYNSRHAARPLPKLQPGDSVHIRDLDRPGTITAQHTNPRSFMVNTEQKFGETGHILCPCQPQHIVHLGQGLRPHTTYGLQPTQAMTASQLYTPEAVGFPKSPNVWIYNSFTACSILFIPSN